MYTIPMIFRISSDGGTISIPRIRRALQSVVNKHATLRTALYFDMEAVVRQSSVQLTPKSNDQELYNLSMIDIDGDENKNNGNID